MDTSFDRRRILGLGVALAAGLSPRVSAQNDKPCAAILLHGKWGGPRSLGLFGRKLEPYCAVEAIELPWAARRNYDAAYPQALQDIAAHVRSFRGQGFRRVVLMGHSFGANAAMAYMARIGDADAVVALAPGHQPAFMYARGIDKDAVDQARELVRTGRGGEKLWVTDVNQGQHKRIRMTAEVLLSYFDPEGLGHMPATAAAFKKPVPFLWIVGTADPIYRAGEDFAFRRAPAHPASRYLVYQGGHGGYDVVSGQVLEWLRSLP